MTCIQIITIIHMSSLLIIIHIFKKLNISSLQAQLSKKFKVHQIPVLVFIDGKTGKVITTDGRNNVLDDPQGISFPWYPQPLDSILKGTISCVTGDLDAEENLRGKVVGYFFSAHWVSQCFVILKIHFNSKYHFNVF